MENDLVRTRLEFSTLFLRVPLLTSHLARLTSLRLEGNLLELGEELSLGPLHASLVTLNIADNGLARLPDLFRQTFTR